MPYSKKVLFSTKILLFATVGIGVTCVLGSLVVTGARSGRTIRERVIATHEVAEALDELESSVWPYINLLSRARRTGQDPLPLHLKEEALLTKVTEKLRDAEAQPLELEPAARQRREDTGQVLREFHHWMLQTEERLRSVPQEPTELNSLEWELYQDYSQHIQLRIVAMNEQEVNEIEQLRVQWDRHIRWSLIAAVAMTGGCILLMGVFALTILQPLRASLRLLRASAEQIGHGDFDIALPPMGGDELGLLARAMTRMASELRTTLQEKQRLVKIEALEQEARRYSALLEETVHTRTLELKASLRELQTTQQQLLFADRLASMGRLAAGVAHEINNPLSFILSNLRFIHQELERAADPSPEFQEVRDAALEARDGAERVRLIVRDLRMLSRPDDVDLGMVDLNEVVRGTTRLVERELRERANLVVDCESVPGVWGNGPRLGQVLLNLLINAAHAITPGRAEGNEVRVTTRARTPGQVTLEVSDTGSGISPEDLSHLFEPFFTTRPQGEGTGLGLSVCRGIISSMGGSIQVESQLGRGTTFRVHLRLEPMEAEPDPTSKGKREELRS